MKIAADSALVYKLLPATKWDGYVLSGLLQGKNTCLLWSW